MGLLDYIDDAVTGIGNAVAGIDEDDKETNWNSIPDDDPNNNDTEISYGITKGDGYTRSFAPGHPSGVGPGTWTKNAGTTHSQERWDDPNTYDYERDGSGADQFRNNIGSNDPRNLMWGRDPGAADAAVNMALQTGAAAQAHGQQVESRDFAIGQGLQNRDALQGHWGPQNAALGTASTYGARLGSLEAEQGPSAAQAQLQAGTNAATAGQIALARSGRGFGGGAASTGLAQSNLAGIQANQANSAAMLRAQEDAAWRARQAANLGNAAGIQTAVGSQFGQQGQADLGAAVANRGQNDAAALNWANQGQDAWKAGVGANFSGQAAAAGIRGAELGAGQNVEDLALRSWAAQNGFDLQQAQMQNQQDAAAWNAVATGGAALADRLSDVREKTRIAPADGAGEDFARSFGGGLGFDGTLYREQTRGSGPNNPSAATPAGFRGATAMPNSQDELEALNKWAGSNGYGSEEMTPMQAKYLGGASEPGALDTPETRPVAREPDMAALDAAAGDAVRNSPASFYDYKNPNAVGAEPGRKYGPMAQDLLRTPAGASAVVKQPDGKLGVDTGRLALVQHGAIADQQRKIDDLSAQLDALMRDQDAFAASPSAVSATGMGH